MYNNLSNATIFSRRLISLQMMEALRVSPEELVEVILCGPLLEQVVQQGGVPALIRRVVTHGDLDKQKHGCEACSSDEKLTQLPENMTRFHLS